MPLYALTYISRAPEVRGEARRLFLAGLVKQADRNNQRVGVTGCLIHVDDYFIQLLEGSRGELSETYRRILADGRHTEVHLVQAGPVLTRQFTGPGLAAFDIASATNPVFLKYRATPDFCPYRIAPDALADLVEQMARVCVRLDASNRASRAKTGDKAA